MKTTSQVWLTILILAGSFSATGDTLPADVARLISERRRELDRIEDRFVREMEKVKLRYARAGDLEKARLIESTIEDLTQDRPVDPAGLEGVWKVTSSANKDWFEVVTIKGGVVSIRKHRQKVLIIGNEIILVYPNDYDRLRISADPDVMRGPNSGGAARTYTRVK